MGTVKLGSTGTMDFRLGLIWGIFVQSSVGLTCYTCIEGKKGVDNCMLSTNCTGGHDVCALTWSEYTSNVVSKGCGYSTCPDERPLCEKPSNCDGSNEVAGGTCHCNTDLCNSAKTVTSSRVILVTPLITLMLIKMIL